MSDKESLPSRLADILATLSENAQQAAVKKSKDLGFDLEGSQIPFEETLINLTQTREILRDALTRGRITQIPLKLQYRLLAEASKVRQNLEAMISGSDAAVPLENSVEDLNATVWQLNLQNLSEGVLAFDSKMNELKAQEAAIRKLLRTTSRLESLSESLDTFTSEAHDRLSKLNDLLEQAQGRHSELARLSTEASEIESKIKGKQSVVDSHEASIAHSTAAANHTAAEIEEQHEQSTSALANIEASKEQFEALENEFKTLFSESEDALKKLTENSSEDVSTLIATTKASVDEHVETETEKVRAAIEKATSIAADIEATSEAAETNREKKLEDGLAASAEAFTEALDEELTAQRTKFSEIENRADVTVQKNNTEAERLTTYLAELESRIHKSIERATGYTLFHSFQSRQAELVSSKQIWALSLGICILIAVGLSAWFVHSIVTTGRYGPIAFMKLAVSLPMIFAITFCSIQYSRERRLEEEYAFKSSISISLEPYRKLVGELIDKDRPEEVSKYTDFLIASISRVFTSPTSQVFDGEDGDGKTADGLLKTAGNIAETLVKAKVK